MASNIDKLNSHLAAAFSRQNINELNLSEIDFIQRYLQQVRDSRTSQNVSNRPMSHNPVCTNMSFINSLKSSENQSERLLSIPSSDTRIGKKSTNYFNPYEYGARQNPLQSVFNQRAMQNDFQFMNDQRPSADMMQQLGLNKSVMDERFPGDIRNVDVESALIHSQLFHTSGQRESRALNRFEQLPFDPQDVNRLIWKDGMPRGGYSSRNDRDEMY